MRQRYSDGRHFGYARLVDAALIENAYRIFAKYPKHLAPTVASFDAEIELRKRVKTTRLRAIDCDDVEVVWWNATGDEHSLKHFLPRVLGCLGCHGILVADVRRKLEQFSFESWPPEEQDVVEALLTAAARKR